ncbi:MAG: hypothetical protein IT537_27175 [Hyphomicrobiales bacterium]|nr:hypothetical protein [Hyphomicrobiales bacterium]
MSTEMMPAAKRDCRAAVAYDLMRDILLDDPHRPPSTSPEFRRYLLDLFAECLLAARGRRAEGRRAERVTTPPRTAAAA